MSLAYCTFCEIAARREPANIRYEDESVLAFDNRLRWAPVMLLIIPKKHMTQEEMWSGTAIGQVGKIAMELGLKFCPRGFRILSNLGRDAIQTQEHAHLHVIGGAPLGPYL